LPGRQHHRLAGADRARAALPGQGLHCYDFNLCGVFYANSRTWLLESLSKFLYSSVQRLVKSLEIHRKIGKMQNNFVGFRERNPSTFVICPWLDSK
jgi:hypothetical protein